MMKKNITNPFHCNLNKTLYPVLGHFLGFLFFVNCSSPGQENKALTGQAGTGDPIETKATATAAAAAEGVGVGPVKTVSLGAETDPALVDKGKAVFESKCTACHKFGERYVGPDLAGVTERRKPEWIMNMVLNPQEMVQKDPSAQELLAEFMTQMPNQNLTGEEARAVLEYFRTKTKK